MNETVGPFQEVALILVTAFPYAAGFVIGYVHRIVSTLWIATSVGYKRGRYGKLD